MKLTSNTVLITGGATGIGFSLARRFAAGGNRVIICGRREDALAEACRSVPELIPIRCDVSDGRERAALCQHVKTHFPELNVLINNAGIQNHLPPLVREQDWERYENELNINLAAPIHLSMLFLPHLLRRERAAILNVSSGLAFVPLAAFPVYCSSKAGLHSFTQSLREQLRSTPVEVIEIIPPAVDTDLGGKGLHTFGVPVDDFTDHVWQGLTAGEKEIAYQSAEKARLAGFEERQEIFGAMNERFRGGHS